MTTLHEIEADGPKPGSPPYWRVSLVILILLFVAAVLFFRSVWLMLPGDITRDFGDAEITGSVAVSLMRWELFGAVSGRNPEYSNLERQISSIGYYSDQ